MRVSFIRVSRDTSVYTRGDANHTYNTIATHYFSPHVAMAMQLKLNYCVSSIVATTIKITQVN